MSRHTLPGQALLLLFLPACGLADHALEVATSGPHHACARLDMALVGAPDEPGAFCVNPYEATIQVLKRGDPGTTDLSVPPKGIIVRGHEGSFPSVGYSFLQWRAFCASFGAHLVRTEEWQAAGSGTLDPAAVWRYPYSRRGPWERGACNMVPDDGRWRDMVLQPNGRFPRCVNPVQAATGDGVFDLLGNLWEFTDPGWDLSVEGFFAAPHSTPCQQEEGRVMYHGATAEQWVSVTSLSAAGEVAHSERGVAEDGTAYTRIPADSGWVFDPQDPPIGFLLYADEPQGPEAMLPIQLSPWRTEDDGAVLYSYLIDTSKDGQPLVEKVGAALYSGTWAYTLFGQPNPIDPDRFRNDLTHTPDFSGTVGARCAVPLSEVEAAVTLRAEIWERHHGPEDTPLDASFTGEQAHL